MGRCGLGLLLGARLSCVGLGLSALSLSVLSLLTLRPAGLASCAAPVIANRPQGSARRGPKPEKMRCHGHPRLAS